MEINPDVTAVSYTKNVIDDVGLGIFREMDVVFGGLDNREARLAINQACYKVNVPWIDGAIEALNGFARVFVPPDGACYECTMSEMDWQLINKRKSCALLTHAEVKEGKIPTTPTSSSVIAGIQVQEMLKLLHKDRNLPVLSGKGYVFNGLTHDSYVVEYQRKSDCMSHYTYDSVIETDMSAANTTLWDFVKFIKSSLGENAIVDFERDISTIAKCSCGEIKDLYMPVHKLSSMDVTCPLCKNTMSFEITHVLTGSETYLNKTFSEIGIPPLHIISAKCDRELFHYELSGDKNIFNF